MEVTDEQRAVLSRELDRVLGTEATTIMMAHLPEGGFDRLASKQDIVDLRVELRDEIAKCATKDDLRHFATKDDLKSFATKDDLKSFATKDDLKGFATKDDLKGFATKDDLKGFATQEHLERFHTREEHAAFRSEVNQRFTSLEGKLESLVHQFRAELRAEINSAITGQTRAVIVSLIGTMTVLSGFMFALIQTASP